MPKDTWNRQPAWEEGRYLTLLIDPIGPDGAPESLTESFYKAADVTVSALSIGAAALLAATAQLSGDTIFSGMLLVAGIHVISREIDKNFLQPASLKKSGFTETDIEIKCIDKRPSAESLKISEAFRPQAWRESAASRKRLLLTAAAPLLLLPFSQTAAVVAALALAPAFARAAGTAFSFDRVARSQWAIVNKPKACASEETDGRVKNHALQPSCLFRPHVMALK